MSCGPLALRKKMSSSPSHSFTWGNKTRGESGGLEALAFENCFGAQKEWRRKCPKKITRQLD